MSLSINKNGIISTESFSEFIVNTFDKNFYVEPDGSMWIRIVHHNNPASVKFNSTDPFTSQVYLDEDRWFNVSLCNYLSDTWEFMIKQATTIGAAEYKYRWTQSYNPMTATYANVAASNITKNTSSGYASFSHGGLYHYEFNSQTYLCTNDGNNGDWWGAVGAWGTHQGGIPAWNGDVVTTGYSDLYLRIDTKANLSKSSFGKNYITNKEILEI